ncbi:sigma-54 interaction domain-containing protein [Nitratidesulfovibrio sp. SRB-5]|uniref:sigma-54 interaction domain-containing protein n=1 Tax=Nitratidesulfovibrio sp. SRB-5 TaxID=2872636 RepID=UPI001CBFF0B2|nr:sigma 54-interacting transcriptional regulator [Nitratidesulfovibrio sp. SRB-5]MBZ2172150.1 sigma 54-interacting transcriptional regulator [Nitratidesulfovibrio sp. SRB-5]
MDALESGRFLREVINTINDGFFLVGPDGRILMANPALERLTGYEAGELVGQTCAVLNCDACVRSRSLGGGHWCRLFDRKDEHRKRCTLVRRDGTSITVLKNAKVLKEDGRVIAAVETITDISAVVEKDRRIEELSRLLGSDEGFAGMVGTSPAMQRVFKIIERAAESDAPVLVLGASGTGKELAARAIHELGRRKNGAYVQLNCAALNEALLESELFGHVRGAFTGAIRDRQGRFEAAHGGDIFLDEIGDIPLPIQVKLLRVLETKRIERVGDNASREVDVRIIAATNRDLGRLVRAGRFREDLLFRINVIPIHLPPLADRREDIPLLAAHFLKGIRERDGRDVTGLTPEALRLLTAYGWPGNVRELRSALEYACVIAEGGRLGVEHLPQHIAGAGWHPECAGSGGTGGVAGNASHADHANHPGAGDRHPDLHPAQVGHGPHGSGEGTARRGGDAGGMPAGAFVYGGRPARHERERAELVEALRAAGGNVSEAARLLGVHRGTVRNRMLRFGIDVHKAVAG